MKNKECILNIIKNTNGISANDIYLKLNKKIDLSTVYRNLEILCKNNIIEKEVRLDKVSYYQVSALHKHVLICKECKKEIILDECPINELSKSLKANNGFIITNHNISIEGICEDCNKKRVI